MKIICIGRNYGAHARELGNAIPQEPVFFLKPETALLPQGSPFKIPQWSAGIHYELELVFRVSRECKAQHVNDLSAFVDGVTLGIDFTDRGLQEQLKAKGLPWEKAKAFDHSAAVGNAFLPLPSNNGTLNFQLERDQRILQQGVSDQMIFSPAALLTHVSTYITLLPGDLLFTGTPAGVGLVAPGDHFVGTLDGRPLIDLHIVA